MVSKWFSEVAQIGSNEWIQYWKPILIIFDPCLNARVWLARYHKNKSCRYRLHVGLCFETKWHIISQYGQGFSFYKLLQGEMGIVGFSVVRLLRSWHFFPHKCHWDSITHVKTKSCENIDEHFEPPGNFLGYPWQREIFRIRSTYTRTGPDTCACAKT